jgi:hypothetical protein
MIHLIRSGEQIPFDIGAAGPLSVFYPEFAAQLRDAA